MENKESGLNVFTDQLDENVVTPTIEESTFVPIFEEVDSINTTVPLVEEQSITPLYEEVGEIKVEPVVPFGYETSSVEVVPETNEEVETAPVTEVSKEVVPFNYEAPVEATPVLETNEEVETAPVTEVSKEVVPFNYENTTVEEPTKTFSYETPVEAVPVLEIKEESTELPLLQEEQVFNSEDVNPALEPTGLSEQEMYEYAKNEPMENPNAKIVLNKQEEKEEPEVIAEEIMDSLKDNSTLKFVIVLGIVLVIALLAIPYLSQLLM